jgi:hypothetical protein
MRTKMRVGGRNCPLSPRLPYWCTRSTEGRELRRDLVKFADFLAKLPQLCNVPLVSTLTQSQDLFVDLETSASPKRRRVAVEIETFAIDPASEAPVAWHLDLGEQEPAFAPSADESTVQLLDFSADDGDSDLEILRGLTDACEGTFEDDESAVGSNEERYLLAMTQIAWVLGGQVAHDTLQSWLTQGLVFGEHPLGTSETLEKVRTLMHYGPAMHALLTRSASAFEAPYTLDSWSDELLMLATGREVTCRTAIRNAGIVAFGLVSS